MQNEPTIKLILWNIYLPFNQKEIKICQMTDLTYRIIDTYDQRYNNESISLENLKEKIEEMIDAESEILVQTLNDTLNYRLQQITGLNIETKLETQSFINDEDYDEEDYYE